ncbi:PDDEXK nuclease domain-containing protein [Legionella maceachernii]|uniref:PDDEXK nuclease domain-containing protein n=1 Tax=Legionella maceachernii TaxID=466 RepID=UPI00399AC4C2
MDSSNYQSERELEDLILDNIVEFLQELGDDFCFVSRQKRMSTRKKDRYLDLLF